MRLVVYPHDLAIGGSQINAIDLARGAAEAGHEVTVFGVPGPLVEYIEKKGLPYVPASSLKYRPAPTRISQLNRLVAQRRIDLVHAYEWPPCLDAYFGPQLFHRVPLLCTVLSMHVPPQLPRNVPLIMGTEELGREARKTHRAPVWVLEPPIDCASDNPQIDGTGIREHIRVRNEEFLVVTVSRLAIDLKLDALVRAIDAVSALAADHPIRLLVIGDGPAANALGSRAAMVNAKAKREVVTLLGAMPNPRSAYAAADLVLGMGSSAMRAMAMGRAVIVQGERGFSMICEPSTVPVFLNQGFYGLGSDSPTCEPLRSQILEMRLDAKRRNEAAQFGLTTIRTRFSLDRALEYLMGVYNTVSCDPPSLDASERFRSATAAFRQEIENHNPWSRYRRRRYQSRLMGAASAGPWPLRN